jgi:pimeloyl-ACP methyl ester carboxylesterase
VAKMVIVDSLPFYGMMFGPQMTPAMVKPVAAQMRDKLEGPETPAVRADNSQKTAAALVLNPEGRKLVAQESLDSNPHVFGEAMYEDLQTDLRADLPNLKTKTLMLYPFDPTLEGPGGMHITQQMFDTLYMGAYKPMPNVTVVRVDGSRHFIMLDQPAKFDALLEAFLKG